MTDLSQAPMWNNVALIIAVAAVVIVLGVAVMVMLRLQQQQRLLLQQQARLQIVTKAAHEVLRLRDELGALKSSTLGVNAEMQALQEKLFGVEQRVQDVAEQDPGGKLYQRAAKLVSQGADVEELMSECELPRAEAELLLSLHRPKAD
ncbi:DUF2802 domain-containing protein [Idiomarina xiamenensis]|uniref:DNA repair ATPase n=1 Tax=Idiomarina xiamenensis 10-D-4 TaxID=740709 RepID=K2KDP2_9GAMM|nr:DUF2802 domain-containing protein [Idiomarina xiamenensis]EKE80814.1 hypothetical protein A10D4_11389 [Idiomarina xiamenensis 10-D-4]